MEHSSHEIHFEYNFLERKDFFQQAEDIDIPLLLRVDADFKIFVDHRLYFQEPIAIFEFYYALRKWKTANRDRIEDFHYYSIDYDEAVYEAGAIIALETNNDTAQLNTIWPRNRVHSTFELNYAVNKLYELEESLQHAIEVYFGFTAVELFEKASY